MIGRRIRFTAWQRVLHWLMAACLLAMLFIGVGMVSTVRPTYLTLVSIHKPLGIAILVLVLSVWRCVCAMARRRCRPICRCR